MATQLDPDLARMLDEMHGQYPSDAASLIHADAASPPPDMRFSIEEAGAAPPQTSGVLPAAEVQRRREAAAAPEFRHETKFYAEPGTADDLSGVVRYGRPVQMDLPESRFASEADPQWTAIVPDAGVRLPEARPLALGQVPDSGLRIGSTRSFEPNNYQLEQPGTEDLMSRYAEAARASAAPVQLPEVEVQPQDVETRTRYSLGPSGQVVDMADKIRKQGEATQQGLLSLAARDKQARAGVALEPKRGEEGFRDWAEELRLAREEDARARRRIGIGATLLSILSPQAAQVLLQATEGGRQNAQRLIEERERLMGEQTSRAEQALERYRAEGVRGLQDARAGAILDERAASAAEQEWLDGTVSPQTAAYVARFTGEDPQVYAGMSNREFAPIAALARARGAPPPDDEDVVAELDRLYEWGSQRGTVRSVDPSGRVTFDTRRGGRGGRRGGGAPAPRVSPEDAEALNRLDLSTREGQIEVAEYLADQLKIPRGTPEYDQYIERTTRLISALGAEGPRSVEALVTRVLTDQSGLGRQVQGNAARFGIANDRDVTFFRTQLDRGVNLYGTLKELDPNTVALAASVIRRGVSFDDDGMARLNFTDELLASLSPEASALVQQFYQFFNPILRERSGAAVTASEAIRAMVESGALSSVNARENLISGVKGFAREINGNIESYERVSSRRAQPAGGDDE